MTMEYKGPVPLPPVNIAPLGMGYWQSLLTERTGLRGVGAAMWLLARIAKHKAARFEDGQRNPTWADPGLESPGTCWLAPRDVAAWLIADGYEVAHEPDIAPATQTAAEKPTPPASPPEAPEWIGRAQETAREYIARLEKKDLFPSQENTANHVAEVLRKQSVHGPRGPLSGSYIKRHALRGISSAKRVDRSLATKPKRGK